ncbi:unnamed protein product, partial [Laminaria digitata]
MLSLIYTICSQALCSYLRGVLCLTAMLHASGVGDEKASATAAAMVWVLRDGFGMIGSLVFVRGVLAHGQQHQGVEAVRRHRQHHWPHARPRGTGVQGKLRPGVFSGHGLQ